MSRYQLDKAMRMLVFNLDPQPAQRFKEDPAGYAGGFDLTEEERQAFCSQDVPRLYSMGVQPFILLAFAQLLRGRPFTNPAELMAFMKEYSAKVAPYGHPDFET